MKNTKTKNTTIKKKVQEASKKPLQYIDLLNNFFSNAREAAQDKPRIMQEDLLEEKITALHEIQQSMKSIQQNRQVLLETSGKLIHYVNYINALKYANTAPLEQQILMLRAGQKPTLEQQILMYGFGDIPQQELQGFEFSPQLQHVNLELIHVKILLLHFEASALEKKFTAALVKRDELLKVILIITKQMNQDLPTVSNNTLINN